MVHLINEMISRKFSKWLCVNLIKKTSFIWYDNNVPLRILLCTACTCGCLYASFASANDYTILSSKATWNISQHTETIYDRPNFVRRKINYVQTASHLRAFSQITISTILTPFQSLNSSNYSVFVLFSFTRVVCHYNRVCLNRDTTVDNRQHSLSLCVFSHLHLLGDQQFHLIGN